MPIITRAGSSQNISKKSSEENSPAPSSIKTNIIEKNKKCSKQLNNNVQGESTTLKKKRCASPIIKTPPKKKSKNKSNDDLITQLEASDKQDLALQEQLRKSIENSGDIPLRSIFKSKNINFPNQVEVSGSTASGSSIVYTAPLHMQSDSEDEEDLDLGENNKSQEYPFNDDHTDDDNLEEMRNLKAKNRNLINDYNILNDKYNLLVERHKKMTRKIAKEKSNVIPKPPPLVLKWMSNVLQIVDKKEEQASRSQADCLEIIKKAAATLNVLPGQLKACYRDIMQKTARRLAFVIWPDPIVRARVNAKNVDREKLKLIYEVCDALHPDLERNETVINTAVFNVCSSTRVKTKRLSKNLNTTQNTSVEDIDLPPLTINDDTEDSDDEEGDENF